MFHEADRQRLARIESKVNRLVVQLLGDDHLQEGVLMTLTDSMKALKDKVTAEQSVEAGAITLLNGLSQQIKDLQAKLAQGVDPTAVAAELDTLAGSIDAHTTDLAAAVTANTVTADAPAAAAPTGGTEGASQATGSGS